MKAAANIHGVNCFQKKWISLNIKINRYQKAYFPCAEKEFFWALHLKPCHFLFERHSLLVLKNSQHPEQGDTAHDLKLLWQTMATESCAEVHLGLPLAHRKAHLRSFFHLTSCSPSFRQFTSRISKYIHTWFLAVPPIHNPWTVLWDYPHRKGHGVYEDSQQVSVGRKKLKTPTNQLS